MKSTASLIVAFAVALVGIVLLLTIPLRSSPPAAPRSPPTVSAPMAPEANGVSVPIAVPDSTLKKGINACTSPYTGELVSKWDGICEANLKVYQCMCLAAGGCDFERTPGTERGDCTVPGSVHPVLAP